MNIKDIFNTFAEDLKMVDRELMGIFKSHVLLIPIIGQHLLGSGGKRMRPLFLLLSAELCGYKKANRALLGAIIEAIHTASLLHDDVIDGAETRRGKPAANAVWGNQVVILVGDFLYSNALKLAVHQKNQKIMEALSDATTSMTEGEILQLHRIGDPEITKEDYFEIISAKTGVLISAACRIGGILAGEPEKREMALARFGMKTGIAFQLADDILDYVAKQKELGKRLGKDLEEGKITMPLIHILKVASESERDEIKAIISSVTDSRRAYAPTVGGSGGQSAVKGKKTGTKKSGQGPSQSLKRIMDLFSKYNAIEESLDIAKGLIAEAKSELDIFPASKEKETLLVMAEYAMHREK